MKIFKKNIVTGEISLKVETDEDLWYLFCILEKDDVLKMYSFRREEKKEDELRKIRTEKKKIFINLTIEKTEYLEDSFLLRVLGIIEGGEFGGKHHSCNIEKDSCLKIVKKNIKKLDLKILEKTSLNVDLKKIFIVVLDKDEATLRYIKNMMIKEVCSIDSENSGKYFKKNESDKYYYEKIFKKINDLYEVESPIIIAGPGFEKEKLIKYISSLKKDYNDKLYLMTTNHVGIVGMNEIFKSEKKLDILKKNQLNEENYYMEKLFYHIKVGDRASYGIEEVKKMSKIGIVDSLLILDGYVRKSDFDEIIEDVEKNMGKIILISKKSIAGEQLESLGGVGAILKYKNY